MEGDGRDPLYQRPANGTAAVDDWRITVSAKGLWLEPLQRLGRAGKRAEADEPRSPLRPGLLPEFGYCMDYFIDLAFHLGEQVSHLVAVALEALGDLRGQGV